MVHNIQLISLITKEKRLFFLPFRKIRIPLQHDKSIKIHIHTDFHYLHGKFINRM